MGSCFWAIKSKWFNDLRPKKTSEVSTMKKLQYLLLLVLAASPVLYADVITFQDGVSPSAGYAGTQDGHIISWDDGDLSGTGQGQLLRNADGSNAGADGTRDAEENPQNMGNLDLMEEGDNGGGANDSKVLLIQFDIGAIPASRAGDVKSAKIGLYFDQLRSGNDNPRHSVYVNPVLKKWAEGVGAGPDLPDDNNYDGTDTPDNSGGVTWNSTGFEFWQAMGAEGPADVGPTESTTQLNPGDVGQFIWFDVTASAKAWIADPGSNNGVKISQEVFPDAFLAPDLDVGGTMLYSAAPVENPTVFPNARFVFRTSENAEASTRPKLVVDMGSAIGNAPSVNDNNRVVGMSGGNIFMNGIVPGGSAGSSVNLGLPAVGAGTPGGGTGAAGLIAAIGTADGAILAYGAGSASANGLTATLNADGSYSLATDASFSGAYVVGLGVGPDIVPVVAAEAVAVGSLNGTYTVASGVAQLVPAGAAVAVGDAGSMVTVSADVTTSSTAANIAVLGFDGAVAGNTVSYTNPGGPALEANVAKNIATSFVSQTGSVVPGYQIFNAGSADVTVTIANFMVIKAGPVAAYAPGTMDLPLTTLGSNLFGAAGYADAVTQGTKAEIAASGGLTGNAFANVTVPKGEVTVSCVAFTANAEAGSTIVVTLVDLGGGFNFASFVDGTAIETQADISTSGTNSIDGAGAIVVVQSTGADLTATGLAVTASVNGSVDPGLLGM